MPGWCAAGSRRNGARCCSRATSSRRAGAAGLPEHLGTFDMRAAARACRRADRRSRPARRAGGRGRADRAGPAGARAAQRRLSAASPRLIEALDWRPAWPQHYVDLGMRAAGRARLSGSTSTACAATGVERRPRLCVAAHRARRIALRRRALPRQAVAAAGFFVARQPTPTATDIVAGLTLTGYFLQHHLLAPQGRALPEARARLAERLRRLTASERLV